MRKPDPELVACYIKLLPEFLALVVFLGMCALWVGIASDTILRERLAAHQMVKR